MEIPYDKARNWLVVDPDTGLVIPHVKTSDPDKGWIEIYTTTACVPAPGYEMAIIEGGVTEHKNYTFVEMRDPDTGKRWYLTSKHHCRFDIVDKFTGEVVFEVTGPRAALRVRDPSKVAEEVRACLR